MKQKEEKIYSLENNHKTIKDWREDERPRERFKKHGAGSLSDAELLAILIRSGTRGYSAIDIARDLIEKYSNLSNLFSSDFSEFKSFKGLGDTKAITLAAAFEIAKRFQSEPYENFKRIRKPEDIANYYIPRLRGAKTETFRALLLNASNNIFREIIVSQGTLNASLVHPREVFKTAISESAAAIILLHNHPSRNPEPSKEDIQITHQLIEAGEIIGIKVMDHIIIAGEQFRSFSQMGIL
ncbi:DNA repair protein RadC [Bacteroidota bacterium]